MPDPVTLVPTKSDVDTAADLRRDMQMALEPLVKVVQAAKDNGFIINFQVGPGPMGRIAILNISVAKEF